VSRSNGLSGVANAAPIELSHLYQRENPGFAWWNSSAKQVWHKKERLRVGCD